MWEYNEKVIKHFEDPQNVGVVDRIDGEGQVGSLACGDALRLTLKINRESSVIEDAKFQTFGCASAIASSSALTELIIGKTIEEALKITNQNIVDYLGGLPGAKMHCSVMGQEALEAAIANYKGEPLKKIEGTIICECFDVTDVEIKKVATENNLSTVEEITAYTKAGGGCGKCLPDIEKILFELKGQVTDSTGEEVKQLTTLQKIRLIESIIQNKIAPALMQDGGDIELVDINGNEVEVRLKGTCASCPSSKRTLSDFVTRELREKVDLNIVVKESRS